MTDEEAAAQMAAFAAMLGGAPGPREHSAETRQAAREMFGTFTAMVEGGFTPLHVCVVLGTMLAVHGTGGQQ